VEKAKYDGKLNELKASFSPCEVRYKESESRPVSIDNLKMTISRFEAFAVSEEEQYAHIEAAERATVKAEVEKASSWLAEAEAKLGGIEKTSDPPVLSSEIDAKVAELHRVCEPIERTPKPAPPPAPTEPAPTPTGQGEAAAEGAAAEGEPAEGASAGSAAPPAPENMDVD